MLETAPIEPKVRPWPVVSGCRQGRSSFKRLTSNTADDYAPSFSPDGARIAFTSNRDGDYEIFTMAIDGTDVKQLTKNTFMDLDPSWAPGRTKIAFSSNRDGNTDLWLMNRDGSSQANLTQTTNQAFLGGDWAPDGTRIAYFRVTFDGTNYPENIGYVTTANVKTNFASTIYYDENPDFLPVNNMIIFDSDFADRGGASESLYVTQTDSLSYTAITSGASVDLQPSWQPVPSFPLVDAQFSTFNADIQWVFNEGITTGCSPERYCPDANVSRAQMASFLARAMSLPPTATDYFTDDNGTTHEANINKVAAAGLTTGCGERMYCPTGNVTRGQMAAFLHRAFGP